MPDFEGKFIDFRDYGKTKSGKTSIWKVKSKNNLIFLGYVKWYGSFRKYCFYPEQYTIYDQECLEEIARFCKNETMKHNKGE